MLQMAEKSTKTKRRALLMVQKEPAEESSTGTFGQTRMTEPAYDPQPLLGDAFERMRMDPEIQQFRRRLMIGAGVVVFIVVMMVVVSLFQSETPTQKKPRDNGEQTDAEEAGKPAVTMVTPDEPQQQVNTGNLVFRPPGSKDLKTAAPLPAAETSENLSKLAAAEEVLTKFLQAPNWKQRAMLVRDRVRVASMMSIYYSKNADGPMEFDSIVEAKEVSTKFSDHVVVFEGGGRRMATVEHTAKGPLVDWESFVGAGEMAWSDFLELKQAAPTLFRVLVSPAGHFENQFGDPAALSCYSLRNVSEPGAKVVYGYVTKSSPLAKELDFRLQQSADATVPMILQLKFPPDAPVDFQVWIHHFVQVGWVTP